MDSCDSDKFYILCEFNNEQKIDKVDEQQTIPVQVGYAEWIIWDDKNKEPRKPISNLIQNKESVLMKWPSNCDVQSKNTMAKRKHIKWIQTVGCILAQSNDWTEIVEASKSCLKYGVPFPSREMRKDLAKKKDEIVNSNSNRKRKLTSDENLGHVNKEITTTNKKQRVSSSEIIRVAAQKTDEIGELDISTSDESQSLSTIRQNLSQKLREKNKGNKGKVKKTQPCLKTDESDSESDWEDLNLSKWKDVTVKNDFTTMIQCTEQLKHVVEDLKTEIRDFTTQTKNLKTAIKGLKSKIRHLTKNMSSDNGKEEISETTSIQIKGTDEVCIPGQYANQKDVVQTSLCAV
ncbi:uncharacterized protein [Temnothorax nylanderi]|uniref:uncharacterized protein n=1 Tax=Temnothorax nylanderi TaxID=102681 RepID=UPI003A88AA83